MQENNLAQNQLQKINSIIQKAKQDNIESCKINELIYSQNIISLIKEGYIVNICLQNLEVENVIELNYCGKKPGQLILSNNRKNPQETINIYFENGEFKVFTCQINESIKESEFIHFIAKKDEAEEIIENFYSKIVLINYALR